MTDKHAIQDVLSQYVRATDERDGDAQAKLFADSGMIRFFGRSGTEEYELAGEPVIGAERIRRHMEGFPPRMPQTTKRPVRWNSSRSAGTRHRRHHPRPREDR
jgi:SnoaL-like domain